MIKKPALKIGFTLIELLVVISIIGVLATLLLANVSGVRERGRDAQRKSDINQIQKALEIYKASLSAPAYPATGFAALATTVENSSAMQKVPHDPKCGWDGASCTSSWPDYLFIKPSADGDSDTLTYDLVACLENKSDASKDLDQTGCFAACKTDAGGVCFSRREP
jgi:prepilin-type N-terminal cleavage/methylation domain-containing protein